MSAVSPGSGIPKDSSITTTNSSGSPCCVMKLVTAVQCRSGRIESPAMRVGAARETAPGERRVALVPETVGKLAGAGFDVVVEPGAGEAASFPDDAYAEAGATLGSPWDADALVKVRKPDDAEAGRLHDGQLIVGFLDPLGDREGVERLAKLGAGGFAIESNPRSTRDPTIASAH